MAAAGPLAHTTRARIFIVSRLEVTRSSSLSIGSRAWLHMRAVEESWTKTPRAPAAQAQAGAQRTFARGHAASRSLRVRCTAALAAAVPRGTIMQKGAGTP